MPVRRLNFTSRQHIAHGDAHFVLRKSESGVPFFDASLDLASYDFPSDARIFVEAYRQTTLMRFDFGSVSGLTPPEDRWLDDFDSAEEVLFRLKVTAVSGLRGVLLGEIDGIRPRELDEVPDKRIPLLPVVADDLDQEIWRVHFEGQTYLHVSKQLVDWKQTAKSETFRALVYPAAMRQVLERILYIENVTTSDDPMNWCSRWLAFASALPGSSPLPKSRDEFEDWIEIAVASFARQFSMRTRFQKESLE